MKGMYAVVEVDDDNVRMSKFIETKLNCRFEDRKAFYEAEKVEDLLYYKKILRPQMKEVNFVSGQQYYAYQWYILEIVTTMTYIQEVHH